MRQSTSSGSTLQARAVAVRPTPNGPLSRNYRVTKQDRRTCEVCGKEITKVERVRVIAEGTTAQPMTAFLSADD